MVARAVKPPERRGLDAVAFNKGRRNYSFPITNGGHREASKGDRKALGGHPRHPEVRQPLSRAQALSLIIAFLSAKGKIKKEARDGIAVCAPDGSDGSV